MKKITNGKNSKDLQDLLKDKRRALADFAQNVFQGKAKNVKEGRGLRKDIARIMTAMEIANKESAKANKK